MNRILIAANETEAIAAIRQSFGDQSGLDIADSPEALWEQGHRRYEYLFVDLRLLGRAALVEGKPDYAPALTTLREKFPGAFVVAMAPQEMIREAVSAVRAGASDYLTYPIDASEIRHVRESIEQSLRMQSELQYLRDHFWQEDSLELVRTHSPLMRRAFEKVRSVAPTRSTVLLTGETGTGKGVLAKLIHRHSHRKTKPFVSVHCGAIPDTLIESELFGHEKGAFTGAVRRKLGKFEIADGGTIFLDEVGTISAPAQIKLLQVLQDRTMERVGGEKSIELDVRIIAATNSDLLRMVREGRFRLDLYYRLNVFPIEIPALRERPEDIPLFVDLFLERLNRYYGKNIRSVHPNVLEAFEGYAWPGNIREMENLVERAYILETGQELGPDGFPSDLFSQDRRGHRQAPDMRLTLAEARRRAVEQTELHYLRELLATHKGRINASAEAAGITTRQLHKLMGKHRLDKQEFKRS
ncbi:MAG: sigma-54 dependent transcriptional regulator [Desulfarculus sp.]|nr:sigma-54 dependent transcriptional regulator [Desulfarculus sp.]